MRLTCAVFAAISRSRPQALDQRQQTRHVAAVDSMPADLVGRPNMGGDHPSLPAELKRDKQLNRRVGRDSRGRWQTRVQHW
jgi:hypothetical protein